ncbi:TPA: sugar transferase, partial [Campylobacter coli]
LINKKLQTKQLERQLGLVLNDVVVSHGNKITIIHPNSAKSRIQNQLSYKLGQAMIANSKSILGYIRMPLVLSYIKDKHKQEQKIYQEKIKKDPSLKLPPLESYPDYKEALKEKECFTYKLGESLIKANKTWYKGGYVRLMFEIGRLKK